MNGLDLYSDEFAHATKEGYAAGCRGAGCPGGIEQGMSCTQVFRRYSGDYGFAKKIDAGMTVREILEAEKRAANPNEGWVVSVVEAAQAHGLVGKDAAGELCSCGFKADSILEHIGGATVAAAERVEAQPATKAEKPRPAAAVAKSKAEKPDKVLPKHGTPSGYSRGCRDGSRCPGDPDTAKSCLEAYREYQRAYAERRKQNGGKPLAKDEAKPEPNPTAPKPPAPAPAPTVATASKPSALELAHAEIAQLRTELAQVTAKLANEQQGDPVNAAALEERNAEVILANGLTVTIAVTLGRAA